MELYPKAKGIFFTADGGGSNGSRSRLWKYCLQEFSEESGLKIHVSHFPPGTSKWNKIEHRLFNHISMNWKNYRADVNVQAAGSWWELKERALYGGAITHMALIALWQ